MQPLFLESDSPPPTPQVAFATVLFVAYKFGKAEFRITVPLWNAPSDSIAFTQLDFINDRPAGRLKTKGLIYP